MIGRKQGVINSDEIGKSLVANCELRVVGCCSVEFSSRRLGSFRCKSAATLLDLVFGDQKAALLNDQLGAGQ